MDRPARPSVLQCWPMQSSNAGRAIAMRPLGVFAVLAAVLWTPLGRSVLGFYEIGGPLMALPLGVLMVISLSALWKEAGTRVNPPRVRLWLAWLFVLPWLMVLAWARFVAPLTTSGFLGLAMMFLGGSGEGSALLQSVRAVHIVIGAALLGWSLYELLAAGRGGPSGAGRSSSP